MLSTIYSISALLLSFGVLCLGHGLNNTLLGIRATIEHYPTWVTGTMMSGYFLGFIFGTALCARLIPIVGHIRTFSAFATIASALSLIHVLYVNEVAWIILRICYGVCIAGLYMVIESWLSSLSNQKNRGRILCIYMAISFLSLALGQIFAFTAAPDKDTLFIVVSVLISLSLVPLTLSQAKQPEVMVTEHFGFKRLFIISPLATIGCASTGLTLGAFWGLGAVYFTKIGMSSHDVATLIGITFLGGFLFQWPIGYFSDLFDRRITIAMVLLLSAFTCVQMVFFVGDGIKGLSMELMLLALLFGGFSYSLYSLFIALANDFIEPRFAVRASGGLITFHAIGAILGPLLASFLMTAVGHNGLFMFIAAVNSVLLIFAVVRIINGRIIPQATSESFVAIPKTSIAMLKLDPRQ